MPTVSLPNTIDLNTQKSAPEIQSNFDAIQAAFNGGLDETNVPNLAAAFTHWKTVFVAGGSVPTQGVGGTVLLPGGNGPGGGSIASVGNANTAPWAFWFDPADWAANARTTRLRIRWVCIVNAVAPATNFTGGLYPVATFGGASGSAPSIATVGTVVTGSTAAFVTPAAGPAAPALSTEFNVPAAGHYVFGMSIGGGMAAGSQIVMNATMQMRQV